MTCDSVNGKLEKIADNNNVVNGYESSKIKNGKVKTRSTALLDDEELETRKSLMILASIFITALIALFYIYKNFPRLDE